jgi:hypothetical protein
MLPVETGMIFYTKIFWNSVKVVGQNYVFLKNFNTHFLKIAISVVF